MKKLNLRKSGSRSVRVPAFGRLGTRSISLGTAILLIFSLLLTPSLAWFSMTRANTPAVLIPGKQPSPKLYIGTVTGNDNPNIENPETERIFTECTPPDATNMGWLGLASGKPTSDTEGKFVFELEDLQFGKIDNLSRLKPENIVYLCLEIPETHGNTVNFTLSNTIAKNSNYFFDIYTDKEEKLNDAKIIDGFNTIQTGDGTTSGTPFLSFEYAFSNTKYTTTDGVTKMPTLDFTEMQMNGTDGTTAVTDSIAIKLPDENDTTTYGGQYAAYAGDNGAKSTENYYLYIKITPNLDAFAYSIEYLNTIMPCHVLFHVQAEFEITTTETTGGNS